MKIFDTIKGIDAWPLLVIIRICAASHQVPTLAEQLHAIGLHVEIVLFVLPVAVIGDVQDTILLHSLNDGLKVVLARRHGFQNDAVFDTLTVCQCIADTESVV